MKTKFIALLCFFAAIQAVYAQLPPVIPEGTKSIITDYFFPDWEVVINCDGVEDVLIGDITLQETDLFKDGELIRGINHASQGRLISKNTGEVFHFQFVCKGYQPLDEFGNFINGSWHSIIVGEKGSISRVKGSFWDGVLTVDESVCWKGSTKD